MTTLETYEGGCKCGLVRYQCRADPFIVLHCHCRDCQRMTGTAYSTFVCVPRNRLDVVGSLNHYAVGESGDRLSWNFCPECGSPVTADIEDNPGTAIVLAGSLDDPSWLEPEMHIFTDDSQPWEHLGGLPQYSAGPPD